MPVRITHGWLIAIACAYLYVFPYFPRIQSANELPRVYLVQAIVEDHTFAIDRQVQLYGGTSDLSSWQGHLYQNKAPGSSLLAVPVYAVVRLFGAPSLAQTMWLCRVVTGVIPALVFLWLLWGFLGRFTPEPELRRLVLVAYAFGSLAMTYSLLYYSHQLSAVCIGSAWILAIDVCDRRRGLVAMAAAGVLAGAAPLVDYQAAFAGVPVAAYVVWRIWAWPLRDKLRMIGVAAAGAAVPIAILLAYHAACFGSPLRTGYATAVVYGSDHAHGLLGMTTPTWRALWGTMLAPDNGLLVLMPWLLLAIPGGVALWRRGDRATVLVAGGVVLLMTYFVTSIGFWRAGWGVGPRYITAMLPFLLPLIAVGLAVVRARPLVLGAACGAIGASVIIYGASAATFPYWPDSVRGVPVTNPLYDVTLFLLRDRGISGLLGIAPFAAIVLGLAGWAMVKVGGWRVVAVAVVVAAAILGAFALVPHGGGAAVQAYVHGATH